MRLEFGLLGPLTVTAGAAEIPVTGARRRALLGRLLLAANRPVSAERLADDLWNGEPPPGALSTLQGHVSSLRGLLGPDRLEHRDGGYVLLVGDDELDAIRFERLVAAGRDALAKGLAAQARDRFGESLGCWRGPALGDLADAGWAQGEIRRLEEQRAATVEGWLEARLALGEHAEVVGLADAAVGDYPYRERLWAHLMLALYRSGRQSEASVAYQRACGLWAEELGLEPSRELADLERAISLHDAALEAPAGSSYLDREPSSDSESPLTPTAASKTLLFTDVVDSVALWEQDAEQMDTAIREHWQITASAVARHHGRVVTFMGDGAYAAFDDAGDAVAAAVVVQREMAAREWPGIGSLSIRMGLNTGECQIFGADVYGRPVNVAARIQGIANGGQILISEATATACRGDLPSSVSTVALGEYRLRGVEESVSVHMVVAEGLPAQFPPLWTPSRGFDELPTETTPLIGRAELIEQVSAAVGRYRLTTLWGPGGVGKTRVAVRVANQARRPFRDGIQFVDLTSVRSPDLIADAMMTLLHAQPLDNESPIATVVRVLRPLRLLIVLDNAEHLRAGVRSLVDMVTSQCPWVHALVTSREALGVEGEHRISVPPLTVPGEHRHDPEYVRQFESVQMFLERASQVESGFVLDESNAEAVARLCRAVDGLPLALELGAARLDVDTIVDLSTSDDKLVDRLERSGSAGRGDSLARSLEWSFDQLSPREQSLYGALATFSSAFTREEAVEMAEDPASAHDDLNHLVRCALVNRDLETRRFRLAVTSRQYAQSRQSEQRWEELREQHARLMLRRALEVGPQFRGADQQHACRILRAEFPDYREAMQWCIERRLVDEGAAILVAVFQFAFNGLLAEVNDWARQLAVLISDRHPLASEVCGAAALAAWSSGDTDAAIALGERAVASAALLGAGSTLWARTALQNALGYAGRMAEVAPHYLAQVEECRQSPDVYWKVQGLGFEAFSLMMAGRPDRARDRVDRALALARRHGNADCLHWALYCLGRILETTDPAAASAAFQQAMEATRSVDSRFYLTLDLLEWVAIRRRLGDMSAAVVGLLELLELLHSSGNSSQLSQMYAEVAQVLVDAGEVAAGTVVLLARSGLPQMPKGAQRTASEAELLDRLRTLAGSEWSVLEIRAMAMTDEALMAFSRVQLEGLLRPSAA